MSTHRLGRAAALALVLGATLTCAACGDDDTTSASATAAATDAGGAAAAVSATTTPATTAEATSPPSSGEATFPVTIDAANGSVEITAQPQAVISLSPTATEMLYAIGAGEQVIAVDDQSNHPPEAPMTDLSGFTPNVEAISSYGPDLVVVADDPAGLTDALAPLGIPVLSLPAATVFDDVYTQLEQLGVATGHVGEAAEVVAGMQAQVDEIVAGLPETATPLTYYHELDNTFFSVTSDTFIGQVYGLLGLQNIADAADPDGAAGGYPQLNAEFIITEDPDLIFLADVKCCGESAETIAARPGWADMTAVSTGAVVELDDDVASRWGPRIVDLLGQVSEAVGEVSASG
ncbi:MAG TPA: ABC transporter substrate-binding protein [Acidimicrobiales bacterium]|jgi:iron complex transport system substrate-binding protein|nr:ABC transporter substrate-binding protein [Acidimicrobiales bacterium]